MNDWIWLKENIFETSKRVPQILSLSYVLLGHHILVNGLKTTPNLTNKKIIEIEKKALVEFKKAAKLGNKLAFSILGYYYENGLADLEINYIKAERFYTESIRNTDIGISLIRLSFLKQYGRPNIIINHILSNEYKKRANKLGSDISLAWIKQLADCHHTPSMFIMASSYYNGLGVEKSKNTAFKYAKIAAENGHAGAQNLIGMIYYEGTDIIEKDKELALRWYKKSAKSNEAAAFYNIAMLYEHGSAVEQNYNEAFKYYHEASKLGSVSGTNIVGFFYEHGIGTEKSKMYAFSNYHKAAMCGSPFGQYNLGRCFLYGIGVEKDVKRAVKWIEHSGKQGHGNSYLTLGIIYDFGICVNQNKKLAKKYYHLAYQNKIENVNKRLIPGIAIDILRMSRVLLSTKSSNSTTPELSRKSSCPQLFHDTKINPSSYDIYPVIRNCHSIPSNLNICNTLINENEDNVDNDSLFNTMNNLSSSSTFSLSKSSSTSCLLNNSSNKILSNTSTFSSTSTLLDSNNDLNSSIKNNSRSSINTLIEMENQYNISECNCTFNKSEISLPSLTKNNKTTSTKLPLEIFYTILSKYNTNNILSQYTISKIRKFIIQESGSHTREEFFNYIEINDFKLTDNHSENIENRINFIAEQFYD